MCPTHATFLESFNIWLESVHVSSSFDSFLFLENSFLLLLKIPQNCVSLLFYVWLKCFPYENSPKKVFIYPLTIFANSSQLILKNAHFSSLNFYLINFRLFEILEKLCFHSFMFKCKLPELKYSSYLPRHDWKIGSQLKSRTIHFFVLWKINFFKVFFSKLCFFNFLMFDFNAFNNKIPEHLHLWNGLQLTSQTVHFYSPTHFIIWWKICFPFQFQILTKLFCTLS